MTVVKNSRSLVLLMCLALLFTGKAFSQNDANPSLLEINPPEGPTDDMVKAIVGVRLINGLGGPADENVTVVIKGNRIVEIGPKNQVDIPDGAEITDGKGKSLMPGLIDSHFHSANNNKQLITLLKNGVTTMRDPGHPIRFYQAQHFTTAQMPRVYTTGAHLDGFPGVYVQQATLIKDADHIRTQIGEYVENGASGIKIYFRLPLKYIGTVVKTADFHKIPVVAHLELVDADDAIMAGLKGIEHVTSFGTSIADPKDAEEFRKSVQEDSNNRRAGRYQLWSKIDLSSDRVQEVLALAAENNVVLSPTLATFEKQFGDEGVKDYEAKGFKNMHDFVGLAHKAGVKIVTGSHNTGRYVKSGMAYQREMELLVAAGLSPLEVISSSTFINAQYFRTQDRLGSIEEGKLADMLLVEGNPSEEIKSMYAIKKVMLNGNWVNHD